MSRWLPEWFTGWTWVGLAPQLALPPILMFTKGVHDDRFLYFFPFLAVALLTLLAAPLWLLVGAGLAYRRRQFVSSVRPSEILALLCLAADTLLGIATATAFGVP